MYAATLTYIYTLPYSSLHTCLLSSHLNIALMKAKRHLSVKHCMGPYWLLIHCCILCHIHIPQMTGTLQDSSKNITQAEMDKSLQQQAESYTNVLDEKESTINKVYRRYCRCKVGGRVCAHAYVCRLL